MTIIDLRAMTMDFLLCILSIPTLAHREFAVKIGQFDERKKGPPR